MGILKRQENEPKINKSGIQTPVDLEDQQHKLTVKAAALSPPQTDTPKKGMPPESSPAPSYATMPTGIPSRTCNQKKPIIIIQKDAEQSSRGKQPTFPSLPGTIQLDQTKANRNRMFNIVDQKNKKNLRATMLQMISSKGRSPQKFEDIPNKNEDKDAWQLIETQASKGLYLLKSDDQHLQGLAIKSMSGLTSLGSSESNF